MGKMIDIKSLKLNERDLRVIDEAGMEKLMDSLKNFEKMLSIRPILIDEDNVIIAGNKKVRALRRLGYKAIPEQWVTRVVGMSSEEKERLAIKDNVHAGDWDSQLLAQVRYYDRLTDWGVGPEVLEDDLDLSSFYEPEDNEEENDTEIEHYKVLNIKVDRDEYEDLMEGVKALKNRGEYVAGLFIKETDNILDDGKEKETA